MVVTLAMAAVVCAEESKVFLPGTQPEENQIKFGSVEQCRMCHSQTQNGRYDPFASWQGGPMANAMRDPVFLAALTIANQDVAGVGEFCIRCHAPSGWLEGRSMPPDGSALIDEDMNNISCTFCHRLVDPRSEEARQFAKELPPGIGNGMMVVDNDNVFRGPYGDDKAGRMRIHRAVKSEFHASSDLCGVCHVVSNPLQADDVRSQSPHAYGHVERTYSEWLLSDFAKRGREGSCQSCHYKAVQDGGYPSRLSDLKREYFVEHGPVGGSTWVQDAIWHLWQGKIKDASQKVFDRSKERAKKMLESAAKLELSFVGADTARLRITNLTGHKLPTGYPEGRRMWVNASFFDGGGKLLGEIGRYGERDDTVLGNSVRVPTLLDPEQTRVYEGLPSISSAQAQKHGLAPGPSFHFVVNDEIAKDNRIPPEGFSNEAFAKYECGPVGAEYADGQYWDDFDMAVPAGTARVTVRLMYQSVSWEYIRFLADENKTDDRGKQLYETWDKTGRCAPTVMGEVSAERGAP